MIYREFSWPLKRLAAAVRQGEGELAPCSHTGLGGREANDRGGVQIFEVHGANMKTLHKVLALSTLAAMLSGGVAFAADDHHDNHHYVKHEEWKHGYHMRHEDWDRGEKVYYRTYHLHQPPAGYEWRLVDGNYVMARVDTGIIGSVVIAGEVH